MEAFTTKGHWWLPGDDPENGIAGILTFDPRGQSKLEMFDAFESWEEMGTTGRVEPVILGYGDKGQAITLLHCLHTGSDFAISGNWWRSATYIPRDVIQGQLFESEENIAFNQMLLKFYGLEGWATSGKGWKLDKVEGLTIVRSAEDDIIVELDGFKLVFRRSYSWSGDQRRSFSVKQNFEINLVVNDSWEYEEFINKIYQIQVFLSLAMRTATWPVSIEAPDPSEANRKASIHFSPSTDFQAEKNLFVHDMYFTLEGVRPKLQLCLNNWFAKSGKLEQVIRLYNLTISKKVSLEQRFLTLAKAVEVYHRQMHDEAYVDEAVFKQICYILETSLPYSIHEGLKQRIHNSIKYTNGPSFGGRLRRIRNRLRQYNEQLFEDYDQFTTAVVGTRNYLTHFDETGESEAKTDGQSLYYMSMRLRYILELCLLSELGFSESDLKEMMTNNLRVRPLPSRPESTHHKT